ncbi:hypothetical protein NGB36_00345 [Streptomyces sp. RB6PN25]|uniref:Uncharacterized protein n=1 Tax=Streptomyces humicola TaxID=2953240 RepID=A0ABT1PN49_9ACTN|nr:hypothetical protein [Streptomyces humicola]MCQ4079104.1 hypothetical protein [Streptomyces humicola]
MKAATKKDYGVSLYDGDLSNGLANILATLLAQNFENFPERVKIARRMPRPVAVYSTDTDSTATIVFGAEEAVIYNDLVGRPSVLVKATVDQILDVSQLKMVGSGLVPVGFFTRRGVRVLGEIAKHRLVVKGLLTHTVMSLQLIALLSIAE